MPLQLPATVLWPSSASSLPDRSWSVILANGRIHAACAADLSAPPAAVRLKAPSESIICAATDSQWALAQRRKEAICGIDEAQNAARQVAQIASEFEVSRRTVFRWLALSRQAPQTSTLLPRARGTPVGAHRIDDRLDKLIAEVIQEVYLTKMRAKKEEVVWMVGLCCASLGLRSPSRKPILARLKEFDLGQVAKARLQGAQAATQNDFVPGNYQTATLAKPEIVEKFVRDHPNICNEFNEVEIRKTVHLQMLANPCDHKLHAQMIEGLGVQPPVNRRSTDMELLGLRLLHRQRPKLMIIDEVHHLLAGSVRQQRQLLNQLKFSSRELRMPIVALGTSEALYAMQTDP
ncbi:MAG: TniB family protein [Polaromonas sp.]|nr:TniB family protein [Polaromonas sp.]